MKKIKRANDIKVEIFKSQGMKRGKNYKTANKNAVLWFSPSGQQRTTWLLSHSPPTPNGIGSRITRKRQKLVGWDKHSLTGQQRAKKITRIILI